MNLTEIIRSIIERSDNPNRYELIPEVIAAIPPDMRDEALAQALRPLIVTVSAAPRRAMLRRVVGSPKRSLIMDEWSQFLRQNLPTDHGFILLRDATAADLRAAAEIRRSQAEALNVEAQRYLELAGELEASGARTLGEMEPLAA